MSDDAAFCALQLEVKRLARATRWLQVGLAVAIAISLGAIGAATWVYRTSGRWDLGNGLTIRDASGRERVFLGLDQLGMPSLRLAETKSRRGNEILIGFHPLGDPFIQMGDVAGNRLELGADVTMGKRAAPFLALLGDGGVRELSLEVLPHNRPRIAIGRTDAPHFEINLVPSGAMEAALRPDPLHTPLWEKIEQAGGDQPQVSPHMYLFGYNHDILWLTPNPAPDRELADSHRRRQEFERQPKPNGGVM